MTLLKYHPKWFTLMLRKVLRRRWLSLIFRNAPSTRRRQSIRTAAWTGTSTTPSAQRARPTRSMGRSPSTILASPGSPSSSSSLSRGGLMSCTLFRLKVWQGPMALKVFNSRTSEIFSTRNFRMLTPSGTGSTLWCWSSSAPSLWSTFASLSSPHNSGAAPMICDPRIYDLDPFITCLTIMRPSVEKRQTWKKWMNEWKKSRNGDSLGPVKLAKYSLHDSWTESNRVPEGQGGS